MSASGYKYEPEINYNLISAEDSEKSIKYLDSYKRGYLFPLESHILNSDGLRKYLESAAVTPEIRADFRFQMKEIENALLNIVRIYSTIESGLEEKHIDNAAHKDFYNIFPESQMEDTKIEFIKMIKSYELLKTFNINVHNEWMFVKEIFESIKRTSLNKLFLEQVLVFKVYPRLELCEQTDFLLRRMAYILKIKKEEIKNDKIEARGDYTSLIRYGISSIFRTDLYEIINEGQEIAKEIAQKKTEKPAVHETCIVNAYFLDSRGNSNFNNSYLYIMNIDEKKFDSEKEKIQKSIYVETHLGAEESTLRKILIREFISHRKNKDKIKEYTDFLIKYFNYAKDSFLLHFSSFSDKEKNYLIYHYGPVYFLKLVMYFMREGRTGFIHRPLKKQKMARELPFEFVKSVLNGWWDENIYRFTSVPDRDSFDIYSYILDTVSNLWFSDQPNIIKKINEDNMLSRAFQTRDHKTMRPIIETQVSYLFYLIYLRFLGQDFIYLSPSLKSQKQSP
ncbi:MAG: hypothetical protein OEZ13_12305 [Spirochaetia bacterium]|nr:hypothetical protein [Spirochaetia bacterium]